MELVDLHIFKTVVEEGSVTAAARRLHRVPSSVSTRLAQLETSLATPLFLREKQRLRLSARGKLLLGYAERMLRLADEARNAMVDPAPRGTLRLGALESTTASRLPEVLARLRHEHPALKLEFMTGTNDSLTAAVMQRQLDAAFVAEAPAEGLGLAALPLFVEQLVLITPLGHAPVRSPRDVTGASIIALPSGCAYRRVLERWLGARHLAVSTVLELGSYHAIVACVAAGGGIALIPESVLQTLPGTEVLRHELPKVHRDVGP
jgi:DNA-binding transcriptional LysR family regulator